MSGRDHYKSPPKYYNKDILSVIYVRKNGRPSNDGSKSSRAVDSIVQALHIASKSSRGAIIDIGPGTWEEDLLIPRLDFCGNRKASRSLSSKNGLIGSDSCHSGLLIRGSVGGSGPVSFENPTNSKRFFPKISSHGDVDGNSNNVFYPSTRLVGNISSFPGTIFELSCLELSGESTSVSLLGSFCTIKACSFIGCYVSIIAESFSDVKLENCYIDCINAVKTRLQSNAKIINSEIIAKRDVLQATDKSLIRLSDSSVIGEVLLENNSLILFSSKPSCDYISLDSTLVKVTRGITTGQMSSILIIE